MANFGFGLLPLWFRLLAGILIVFVAGICRAQEPADAYDPEAALAVSQAAVGRELPDMTFTGSNGNTVRLSEFRGRPLLISMVFTSCHHVCPATTRHLDNAVRKARATFGQDSFNVVTLGFDTAVDTPEAMRHFARQQGVSDPNWAFLSGPADSVRALTESTGFIYFPSPRGFDHLNQVTVVDADGVIYRQVYGAAFDLPWLVEPLKQLIYNRPQPNDHFGVGLLNRIKLFCTVYDPSTGAYRFDYSLFIGMFIGGLSVLAIIAWLFRERMRARRDGGSSTDA